MTDERPSAFQSMGTFLGVPRGTLDDLGDAKAVILGAPIDWGTTYRPGARFGPKAIREADYMGMDGYRPNLFTGIDPLGALGVVDLGDIPGASHPQEQIDCLRAMMKRIGESGVVPIVLGGDHSITWPNAGGIADAYGHDRVALIHFDAHADTGSDSSGPLGSHGAPMHRLITSGAIPGHRFAQIGLRGYWPFPKDVAWMKEQGIQSHFMDEIVERGLPAVVDDAIARAGADTEGVFLSVDIDVVDPGNAPGTGTPEPGGLTPRQLLDEVRRIARSVRILGADVVEVSPPYDVSDITAALANRVVLEILHGMAERELAE
jgi:agmatinase